MNTITNIKINYMIIEQILDVTGFCKKFVDKRKYFDVLFKQAKTGKIDNLYKDEETRKVVFDKLADLTGLSKEYLLGDKRIELDVKCINKELNYDDESIETIDLSNDQPIINKINDEDHEDHGYHGVLYQGILKNPLHLDYNRVYSKTIGSELVNRESKIEVALNDIESIYSLRGLLMVILLNLTNEFELKDTSNVYYDAKWDPYVIELSKATDPFISYDLKFVEFKKGLVQTLIMNLFDLD